LVRRRLAAVTAGSLAAALLAIAAPAAGPSAAAERAGQTPGTRPTSTAGSGQAPPTRTATTAPTGTAAVTPSGSPADVAPVVDRVVGDRRIGEASGMVSSVRHAGVVWMHQDSGHPAQVFAVGPDGRTVATVGLRGAQATDWESMAMTRDNAGRWMLAIGDIGDNRAARADVRVLLAREPAALRNAKVPVLRTLRLRYPGGATDAETLVADPRNRRLYVVTKGLLGGELYAVPQQAWPGGGKASAESRVWPLELVARVDMSLVTDGTFLPDGRLVLRNYGSMTVYADPTRADGTLAPLSTMVLPEQPQGESVALGPGGTSLLVGSEGVRQPLMRLALPTVIAGATTRVAATSTPAVNDAVAVRDTAESGSGGGVPPLLLLVMVAGVVLLLLIFGAVLIALR
jgi:hypothetical protein